MDKPKKKVSNIMLVLICTMIILYTAADFALQYCLDYSVSFFKLYKLKSHFSHIHRITC